VTTAPPVLIFVHGGFCDASDWRSLIALLEPAFSIVAEDLPGHGDAPLPLEPTIAALADALCGMIPCTAPVVIIGHSMGCAVALEALRCAPEVAGLILIEGGMGAYADSNRTRDALQAQIDTLGIGEFLSRIADAWFEDTHLRRKARERLLRLDVEFARGLLLDAVRWDGEDASAALAAVSVPIIVIQTTLAGPDRRRSLSRDESTPWLDLVRAQAPDARIRVLEGMGHFPHIEHSAAIAQIITHFAGEFTPS
jgi:pimeloyl-ACP methyl ester carboxylesterase